MYNILTKYKKFIFVLVKWLVVVLACYFIYRKIMESPGLSIETLKHHLSLALDNNIWILLFILLLTDGNWLAEIHKWKLLASTTQKTTFTEAFEQCLAAMTVAIITPNKIGEYGAKVTYFKKINRKSIALLALLGNLQQLTVTIAFGCIGGFAVLMKYDIRLTDNQWNGLYIALLIIGVAGILYGKYRKRIIPFKISRAVLRETFGLSILRYLFFSHQFFLLCTVFELGIPYFTAMPLIFSMYLLASVIPALTLFDWAVKGSIAVLLFGLTSANELIILSITTIMWILNFGIPALLGSVFVLNHSTNPEQ